MGSRGIELAVAEEEEVEEVAWRAVGRHPVARRRLRKAARVGGQTIQEALDLAKAAGAADLGCEGCMCGDIADQVGSAQSTVSQHLKILKDAGVIHGTIDGLRVCYCVNPHVLTAMADYLTTLSRMGPHISPGECDGC